MEDDESQYIPDVHAYLLTLDPPSVFQSDELPQTEVQRELQAANADVFESWIVDVVERWFSSPSGTPPEIAMVDLFRDFIKYAERTNARRLIECIRYQEFVSKFAICRWRKAFAWKQLASDIGVDTS
mmetsp:Transcript_43497/g.120246  ORF Transcript_43497/g.120246 Transcript_43497/m.120246 type:complete len:127 (+) Transcript_43497:2414-2794(+)